MATKSIAWQTGSGNITLTYSGQGDGTISIRTDMNDLDVPRSQQVTIHAVNDDRLSETITVRQEAGPNFRLYGGDILRLADGNYLSVANSND